MLLHRRIVQAERELVDVPLQVLLARVMVNTMQTALHNRPYALDAVGANATAHVFLAAVIDGSVLEEHPIQAGVAAMFVRMQRRARFHVHVDGILQVIGRYALHGFGLSATATLAHPQDRDLAHRTSARVQLLLAVLVLFLAADVGLVYLNDAPQHIHVIVPASLTKPLEHEPGRLLSDSDFLGQLQATDALAGSHQQVHGIQPFMQRNMGPLEYGPGADGEIQLAGVAAVETVLAGGDALHFGAARALHAFGPNPALHIQAGGLLVREQAEKLENADGGFVVHGRNPAGIWGYSAPDRQGSQVYNSQSFCIFIFHFLEVRHDKTPIKK